MEPLQQATVIQNQVLQKQVSGATRRIPGLVMALLVGGGAALPLLGAGPTALAPFGLGPLSAEAKVLADGKEKKGFYWQKVEKADKKVVYMCRSKGKTGSKLEKNASCEKAGAVKP
jgi:hypothetical protein